MERDRPKADLGFNFLALAFVEDTEAQSAVLLEHVSDQRLADL